MTIDLKGFAIIGPGVPGPGLGISIVIAGPGGSGTNVTVRNGTIRGVGSTGISGVNPATRVQDVRVLLAGRNGIAICSGTSGCVVERSEVSACGGVGISLGGYNGIVRESSSSYNNGGGISVSSGGLVESSSAYANVGNGIAAAGFSNVVGNVSRNNTVDGIAVDGGSRVHGNSVSGNGDDGIQTQGATGSSVTGNVALGNNFGLYLHFDTAIGGNTVSGSTTSDIVAGPGVLIACNAIGGVASCPP